MTHELTLSDVRRILRGMGKRIGDGDIARLAEVRSLRSDLDAIEAEMVRSLRSPRWNYTWDEIGRELGISKQAAQQRWGHLQDGDGVPPADQPTVRL